MLTCCGTDVFVGDILRMARLHGDEFQFGDDSPYSVGHQFSTGHDRKFQNQPIITAVGKRLLVRGRQT
jgi:hypothetical protein